MRNIAIQQKGQVQEVQVVVKDAAQEAQEARVNCEEANVSQKLLLKDVEKKVKMKRRRSFAHFYPTKALQTQQPPPIQQTQQRQMAQQTQQTPPIQQTQQSQTAQQTQQTPPIQQTQQSQTA